MYILHEKRGCIREEDECVTCAYLNLLTLSSTGSPV